MRAAEIDQGYDETFQSQLGRALSRRRRTQIGVALLENHRPWTLAWREIQVARETLAVTHRDHPMLFRNWLEIKVGLLLSGGNRKRKPEETHRQQQCMRIEKRVA